MSETHLHGYIYVCLCIYNRDIFNVIFHVNNEISIDNIQQQKILLLSSKQSWRANRFRF